MPNRIYVSVFWFAGAHSASYPLLTSTGTLLLSFASLSPYVNSSGTATSRAGLIMILLLILYDQVDARIILLEAYARNAQRTEYCHRTSCHHMNTDHKD